MKKITTLALILVFIGAIPISCNFPCGSCGCGDFKVQDFTITSFGLKTTNSLHDEIDTTKTYPFDAIYKTLYIKGWQYVFLPDDGDNNSLFINVANACSPLPMKAAEHFQQIKIISSQNITLVDDNDLIAADQDITDRFVMANAYTIDFQSISNFIKNDTVVYEDYSYRIRLAKKPFKETNLNLKITILMTNGKTFEFDNQIMKVN